MSSRIIPNRVVAASFFQRPSVRFSVLRLRLRGIRSRRDIAYAPKPFDRTETVEVERGNCQARFFVAWYPVASDNRSKLMYVNKCGPSGGNYHERPAQGFHTAAGGDGLPTFQTQLNCRRAEGHFSSVFYATKAASSSRPLE